MAKIKCVYPFPVLVIRAAHTVDTLPPEPDSKPWEGGRQVWVCRDVRLSFWQPEGKPWDWQRARRMADQFYPAGHGAISIEHDGQTYIEGAVIELGAARKRAMPPRQLAALVARFLAGEVDRDALAAAVAA